MELTFRGTVQVDDPGRLAAHRPLRDQQVERWAGVRLRLWLDCCADRAWHSQEASAHVLAYPEQHFAVTAWRVLWYSLDQLRPSCFGRQPGGHRQL